MKKLLGILVLGLFIAYYLFDLNGLTVIFWAIALCVGYALLLASKKIWQKRKIRKYHKKHKTIPKTYEDLEKHLKSSISVMPHLKKKLTLPNVTLLAVTSVEIEEHQMSLKISSQNIEFGAVKLLSSSLPEKKYSDIEYVSVKPMGRPENNRFLMGDLHKYFETSHCLYVQAHSFVVNAHLWKEEFLEFDYIGAPMPNKIQINSNIIKEGSFLYNPNIHEPVNENLILNMKENCVGTGGFSLRSRKLLKTVAKINYDSLKFPILNEDLIICHYLYKELIDKGIRFAPPKLAAQFAMEWDALHLYGQDVNSVFGFHARHMRDYFLKEYMRRAAIGKW
jgi:hypothetical protein